MKTAISFPKPKPHRLVKDAKKRVERKVILDVRAQCVTRDGYCRLFRLKVGDVIIGSTSWHRCHGQSEWAHLGAMKRARTRGMAAERRHRTDGSVMLCRLAHAAYDAGKLDIRGNPDIALVFQWIRG